MIKTGMGKARRKQPMICVVTTTYNMADTITRTYESVLAQTYRCFYWLVIDNGSTDNTRNVIDGFISEQKIKIEYVHKAHGIRATAINAMIDYLDGDLCIEIHADDALKPDALAIFAREWMKISDADRDGIWAMAAHCEDGRTHKIVGREFPVGINRHPKKAWRYQYRTVGEKHYAMNARVVKTRRIDTDVPDDVNYLNESLLWIEYQREFRMWFINEKTRLYFDDSPNRYSTRSGNKLPEQTRRAAYYSHLKILNTFFRYDKKPWIEYLRHAGIGFYNGMMLGMTLNRIALDLPDHWSRMLLKVSWPLLRLRKALCQKFKN